MKKNYLIVVVAHSVHGRIRRLHIPHYALHLVLCFAIFGAIVSIGFVSSYARMFWKVTEFNTLRSEKEALRQQYEELQRTVQERNVQLASLGDLASEVSIAFGIRRPFAEQTTLLGDMPASRYTSFVNQYDFLQQVQLSPQGSNSLWYWLENTTPSLWPVQGSLTSSFGKRIAFDGDSRRVIDGPFGTPTELVAGYWIWNVTDMEEAIAWAKRCPNPMPGPSELEIRPFYEAADFGDALTPEQAEQEERLRDRLAQKID